MHLIPDVTVVVPCFNEEDGLPTLLARLRAMRTGRAQQLAVPVHRRWQHWTTRSPRCCAPHATNRG